MWKCLITQGKLCFVPHLLGVTPPIHVHVLAVYVTVAAGTRPGSGVTSQATGKVP